MARNPYTDEEKDGPAPDDVEHLGGTPGGGLSAASAPGSTALGMSSSGNAATAQPSTGKHDRQDQFVSWDRLFNANAGNADRTVGAIQDKVQGQVDTAEGATQTLINNAQHDTSTGTHGEATVTPGPAITTPNASTPTEDIFNTLGGLFGRAPKPASTTTTTPAVRSGTVTYDGPTELSQVAGYHEAQAAGQKVANSMDVYKNRRNGNIMSLLGNNTPGGSARLDNALVNRSGGDRFDATYGQYGNYADTQLNNAQTYFGGWVDEAQRGAAAQNAAGDTEAAEQNHPSLGSDNQQHGIQTPGTMPGPKPREKDWLDKVTDGFWSTFR